MQKKTARDIGDLEFPLEANIPEEVLYTHEHVGKKAEVTAYADRFLQPLREEEVTITGVILKGGQIAGYKVKHKGATHYGPKKSFFVEHALVEDVHLDSAQAKHIRTLLGHNQVSHDYHHSTMDGVEAMYFELAKATQVAAVEVAPEYSYPSSTRESNDGLDWRLLVPGFSGVVAINCHTLVHDNVWTLATTIYSTRDVDISKLRTLGHHDHWTRTLVWTLATLPKAKENAPIAKELQKRIACGEKLQKLVQKLNPRVEAALQKLFDPSAKLAPLSIGLGKVRIEPNHVGRYEHPSDECPYGILTIHPKTWDEKDYLFQIVKHELIHHALGSLPGRRKPHDKDFKRMAEALNLPEKYRG
jgi:hypothetical protein